MEHYDILVVGAGPGGYTAAIRSAQLGYKTALIEKDELGGTCLNWGCIPSKALLKNAEVLDLIKRAGDYGISIQSFAADYEKGHSRSRNVVSKLVAGVSYLVRKNGIDFIKGEAKFLDKDSLVINNESKVSADNIIIATGGKPRPMANLPFDGSRILDSKQILEMKKLPKSLGIVGGGSVGVEFASLFNSYGVEVTLFEMLPDIVPNEDHDISKFLKDSFGKRGIEIVTNSSSLEVSDSEHGVEITLRPTGGEEVIKEFDKLLLAIGIVPEIDSLGAISTDVELTNGWIKVNSSMQTSLPNIYAIGDITGILPLAHVAQAQGVLAVSRIHGEQIPDLDYANMPRATYCYPQIASFGLTEQQAIDKGCQINVGEFPFRANGKAITSSEAVGFCKIVADSDSREILGVHLVGPEVTELVAELSMTKALNGTIDELAMMTHAHPTLSEVLKEASLAVFGQAIHA
jgi:dihydrolipoamide dehydrogenase